MPVAFWDRCTFPQAPGYYEIFPGARNSDLVFHGSVLCGIGRDIETCSDFSSDALFRARSERKVVQKTRSRDLMQHLPKRVLGSMARRAEETTCTFS
jgi:hypothetical protein